MNELASTSREANRADRLDEEAGAPRIRSLLGSLGLLLLAIDGGWGGDGPPEDGFGPSPRWEDDVYVYFEAEIPGVTLGSADISIQDGKAFIRVEK